jgi:hypothetical protein
MCAAHIKYKNSNMADRAGGALRPIFCRTDLEPSICTSAGLKNERALSASNAPLRAWLAGRRDGGSGVAASFFGRRSVPTQRLGLIVVPFMPARVFAGPPI